MVPSTTAQRRFDLRAGYPHRIAHSHVGRGDRRTVWWNAMTQSGAPLLRIRSGPAFTRRGPATVTRTGRIWFSVKVRPTPA